MVKISSKSSIGDMMYPTRTLLEKTVYDYMSDMGTVTLQQLYAHVKNACMTEKYDIGSLDGTDPQICHDIRWTLQTLKHKGKIHWGGKKSVWSVTR